MLVTGGLGAASFSDTQGDDNAAPDITSFLLTETEGALSLQVTVAGEALPANSWFNLWFDVDNDPDTGDVVGDDALVYFAASGAIELYRWDGETFAQTSADGILGSFEAGRLAMTIPTSLLGSLSSPGILVVGARSQVVATETLIASDFAPDTGRSRWVAGEELVIPDAESDFDAAPDITAIGVSDAKDGWIRFAVSTPNRETLPGKSIVAVSIDQDSNRATGDDGAEVTLTDLGGEVSLQRWSAGSRRWVDDAPPTRLRAGSADHVVTIDVHRSELGNATRFGFRLVSADLNATTGALLAVDFAPDSGGFWPYRLASVPALRLVAGKPRGAPARPLAGKAFTIRMPVRRTDTNRAITSGTVTCNVRAGTARVRATGRVRRGNGECRLVVPRSARALRGSMTVRSGGKAVTARFSFRVR